MLMLAQICIFAPTANTGGFVDIANVQLVICKVNDIFPEASAKLLQLAPTRFGPSTRLLAQPDYGLELPRKVWSN